MLKECGCYDGPAGPDDDTWIEKRCEDHGGKPVPRTFEERLAARLEGQPKMAVPRG